MAICGVFEDSIHAFTVLNYPDFIIPSIPKSISKKAYTNIRISVPFNH